MRKLSDPVIRSLPPSVKSFIRAVWFEFDDLRDRLLGRSDPLLPPRRCVHDIGGGDFKRIGDEFLRYFIDYAQFRPDERVLDVGCGYGRMAVPLTSYLTESGAYWGFDLNKDAIAWCQDRIQPKRDNFHFAHADIFNGNYNPRGSIQASEYRFPFEDDFFDFVVLTSVFTHMLSVDLENYIAEIARVLRPTGRSLISYLLLNEESKSLIEAGSGKLNLIHPLENGATVDPKNPEITVGYDEPFIRGLYEKYGLAIIEPIHYGSWCGRKICLDFQDLIIASKLVSKT